MNKHNVLVIVAFVLIGLSTLGWSNRVKTPLFINESLHLTKEQGSIPLARLIKEQSSIVIPNRPISKIEFLVSSLKSPLVLPGTEFQPTGFEFGIDVGDSKLLNIPRLPINGEVALEFFLVRTEGTCDFILYVEFYE